MSSTARMHHSPQKGLTSIPTWVSGCPPSPQIVCWFVVCTELSICPRPVSWRSVETAAPKLSFWESWHSHPVKEEFCASSLGSLVSKYPKPHSNKIQVNLSCAAQRGGNKFAGQSYSSPLSAASAFFLFMDIM